MEARGERLFGVRLDSGDIADLSRKARKMLDDAGLHDVKIMASNQLDEYLVKNLLEQGAPVDAFGIGTRLVTGLDDAALDGVYKLTMFGGKPRLKIPETHEKIILPGIRTYSGALMTLATFVRTVSHCLDSHADGVG